MSEPVNEIAEKKTELRAFLAIVIFLFPILAVALVVGYGFLVWMFQLLTSSSAI